MCWEESKVLTATLTYSFTYNNVVTFPYGGGNESDTLDFSVIAIWNRVTMASKGLKSRYEDLEDLTTIRAALGPNEYFHLASCCCPCNWLVITNGPVTVLGVGTFYESNTNYFGSGPKSGTNFLDASITPCDIKSNVAQYEFLCGRNLTYEEQSTYWNNFDGVTKNDPAIFDSANGFGIGLPVASYVGDPEYAGLTIVAPGQIDGIITPYSLPSGSFFYFTDFPALAPVDGVTPGSPNHGFRQPCDTDVSFEQTVSWNMDRTNILGAPVNGTGHATFSIAFAPGP